MAAARKLRDRLATAAGLALTEEPVVIVPAADKTESLAKTASQGMQAIQSLFAERNHLAELSADLNQKLNNVQAINVGLREEKDYYRHQCETLIKANARLGAYLSQMHDMFRRIAGETQQVNAIIDQMPQPAPVNNNPNLPRVDAVGLPVQEVEQSQFSPEGIPYNAANGTSASIVRPEDIAAMLHEMEQRDAAGHA